MATALVDGLWPRGVRKSDACLDAWWKECAPSEELRKWFGYDPAKWDQFTARYAEELEASRQEMGRCVERAGNGPDACPRCKG